METILVTGGAGFIGSHLCEKLLDRGFRVICFDNITTGSIDSVNSLRENKNFLFIKGDVNTEDINPVFRNNEIDYVAHYAAFVGVKANVDNPAGALNDVKGIQNIFELSRKHNVKKIIYASSSEVYGEPIELPEREDGPINPALAYGCVKLLGENFAKSYYDQYGMKTCSLRLFNVYGPKQISTAYGFVTGIFINQILNNKPPTVFGDGNQTRDFTFIEDNVEATLRALDTDASNGEIINIATGKPTRIIDLANKIIKLSNKDLKPTFHLPREYEIKHRYADISKMRKLLRFSPKHTLEEGLEKTIAWYKKV